MNKKLVLSLSIILILSISAVAVSAGFFDSLFKGTLGEMITGKAAGDPCTDTDGGENYALKGTATSQYGQATDQCITRQASSYTGVPVDQCSGNECYLKEAICIDSQLAGYLQPTSYEGSIACPGGCKDGVCFSASATGLCIDTDPNDDIHIKGGATDKDKNYNVDTCIGVPVNRVSQIKCLPDNTFTWVAFNCPTGEVCSDGICTQKTAVPCIDSDAEQQAIGTDAYVQGTVTKGSETKTDGCWLKGRDYYEMIDYDCVVSGCYVQEFYCDPVTKEITYKNYEKGDKCFYGCRNGACLLPAGVSPCIDTDPNDDIHIKGGATDKDKNYNVDTCIGVPVNRVSQIKCLPDNTFTWVAFDCPSGEVCNDGICTQKTAAEKTCSSNADCDATKKELCLKPAGASTGTCVQVELPTLAGECLTGCEVTIAGAKRCTPFGTRVIDWPFATGEGLFSGAYIGPAFCALSSAWKEQVPTIRDCNLDFDADFLTEAELALCISIAKATLCTNDFECRSNECSEGKCVSLEELKAELTGFKKFVCKALDIIGLAPKSEGQLCFGLMQ